MGNGPWTVVRPSITNGFTPAPMMRGAPKTGGVPTAIQGIERK